MTDEGHERDNRIAIWIAALIVVAVVVAMILVLELIGNGGSSKPDTKGSSPPSSADTSAPPTGVNSGVDNDGINSGAVVDFDNATPRPASVGDTAPAVPCVGVPGPPAKSGVWVNVTVAMPGAPCWQPTVSVQQTSARVEVLAEYRNVSDGPQNEVSVRALLAEGLSLVPATTEVYNAVHPDGTLLDNNKLDDNGENLGTYAAGTNAFVKFEVELPVETDTPCGSTDYGVTIGAKPQGHSETFSSTDIRVTRDC